MTTAEASLQDMRGSKNALRRMGIMLGASQSPDLNAVDPLQESLD